MKKLILASFVLTANIAIADVGMIKFYNEVRGFGFITPFGGTKDCLMLEKNIYPADLPKISHGLCVLFEPQMEDRTCTALDIHLIECPKD